MQKYDLIFTFVYIRRYGMIKHKTITSSQKIFNYSLYLGMFNKLFMNHSNAVSSLIYKLLIKK